MNDFNDFIIHSNITPWGHVWHIITAQGKGYVTAEYDNDVLDTIFIYGLSVIPDVRNQGIGKSLIGAVENLAKENDKKRLRLNIDKPKSWLYDFYTKLGYKYFDENYESICMEKFI